MNIANKIFKIMILEDNRFFNRLLGKYLFNYTKEIAHYNNLNIEISSFTNYQDFIRNLTPDTDMIFIDYYLGQDKTGLDLIPEIKFIANKSKIAVISQSQGVHASLLTLKEGAHEFIYKDNSVLERSGLMVEGVINEKLKRQDDI